MIEGAPSVMMQEVPPDILTDNISLEEDGDPNERVSQAYVRYKQRGRLAPALFLSPPPLKLRPCVARLPFRLQDKQRVPENEFYDPSPSDPA